MFSAVFESRMKLSVQGLPSRTGRMSKARSLMDARGQVEQAGLGNAPWFSKGLNVPSAVVIPTCCAMGVITPPPFR